MPTTIDQLAYNFERAKEQEDSARQARIKAEDALIEAVGADEEGTRTEKSDWYKVSVTAKLNRKLMATIDMTDKLYQAITRVKHELDVTALKKLATSDPNAYSEACRFIETKPAKTAVKVERIINQTTNQQEAA